MQLKGLQVDDPEHQARGISRKRLYNVMDYGRTTISQLVVRRALKLASTSTQFYHSPLGHWQKPMSYCEGFFAPWTLRFHLSSIVDGKVRQICKRFGFQTARESIGKRNHADYGPG